MNGLVRVDDYRGTQTRHVQKQKRCQQDGQSEFRSALHTPCRIACTLRATNPRSNIPHGFAPLSTSRFRCFGLKHTLKWGNFPADLADSGHSFRSDAGREGLQSAISGRPPCFGIVFASSTCIVVGSDG